MIGARLAGRFRVTGPPLGEGASGVVHPAIDEETGREVAVKRLHEHLIGDPAAVARLEAEVGIAGRLAHPHVVGVHGLWRDGDQLLLVADRADGAALEKVDGPLAPEAVIALGLQLCDALEAAHRARLVHGDVRPGNVLLGPAGALLFDFGVRGVLALDPSRPGVRPGETAPEVSAGAPPGPAADLYGLGVVLYRAMSGQLPWAGANPFVALTAQAEGPPAPPPGPVGLATLVRELLHPDPARRPADAAAVATALRRLRDRPARIARSPRRWVAPIRPWGAWIVHGTDPATGGRALVRDRLGRGAARGLAERLRDEGWDVTATKAALSVGDLAWVALIAVVVGVILPVVGAPLGAAVGLRWRSGLVQHRLVDVLPIVRAPVPPREASPGGEVAVAIGALLLAAAVALWLEPWAALVPLLLAVAVAWGARRARAPSEEEVALTARITTVLAEARAAIEQRAHALDRALALHGEIDALERGWSRGDLVGREVLARAEALRTRAGEADRRADAAAARTLEALRRSGTNLER